METENAETHIEHVQGSGAYIKRFENIIACNRYNTSPANMIRHLLRQTFGDEYILSHSALGTKKSRPAADTDVMTSIEEFVRSRFANQNVEFPVMTTLFNDLGRDINKLHKRRRGHYNKKKDKNQDSHHWKNTPASELPGIGTVHGPKTHVAKGYFVDSYEYEKIQYSESPSSYARQLSVILFGEMVLRSSTVCGKVCPRFKKEKARPELCFKKMEAIRDNFKHWLTSRGTNEKDIAVELGLMNKYIGSKICDLRRPPRVSSSKRTKSNPKSKKSGNFEEFGSDSQPLPASTDKFGEDENSQGSQDSQADDDDNLASLSSIENLETNNSFGEFDEESQMNLIHQVIEKK